MTIKPEHKRILSTTLSRMQWVEQLERPAPWKRLEVEDFEDMVEHGPAYSSTSWFHPRGEAERMRYQRGIRDLESAGLVETWARWGQKMTHLRLTDAGRSLAEQLEAKACQKLEQ